MMCGGISAALGLATAECHAPPCSSPDRRRARGAACRELAAGSDGRRFAGAVLIGSAALTLFAPQMVAAAPWLHPWMPYLCTVDAP